MSSASGGLWIIIGALTVVPVYTQSGGPSSLPYVVPGSCVAGVEFFHPAQLSCVRCGANQVTSSDGLSCTCAGGFVQAGGSQNCVQCTNETVSSQDSLYCVHCETGFNPVTGQCNQCPGGAGFIYVDNLPMVGGANGTRRCVECPQGTFADVNGFECVPCGVSDCSQCTSATTYGGVCFPPSPTLSSPPPNAFSYYQEHYTAATSLCPSGNTSSCQLLANLCALQLYNRADPACDLTQQLPQNLLQSLYYPLGSGDELLERRDIQTTLSTQETGAQPSFLPLWVGSYSLNGTFLGLERLSEQILLCKDLQPRASAIWRVGVAYQVQCTVSANALLRMGSNIPIFYELYYRDQTGSSDTLHPLPVLITNYQDLSGEAVNENTNVRRWQFVRRFFLFESVTARPFYTSSTTLTVLVDPGGRPAIPYLTVTYSDWNANSEDLSTTHQTLYRGSGQGFLIAMVVLSVLCAVMGGVYSGLKVNGFLRRTGLTCCDLHSFVFAVVMFCSGSSTLLYLLLSALSLFWLIFYKVVLLLAPPSPNEELTFIIVLALATLFRALHVLYLLWYQSTVDVFFIDWEKPRGLVQSTNQNGDATQTMPPNTMTPVSIWRTYFVVNEWNELQALRRVNHTVVVVMTFLFVQVIGLEQLAESDLSSSVTFDPLQYAAPFSPILRFSIATIFFSLFAAITRGYMFLIYERYFEHKLRQFVDLCSVANVSVLVLSRTLYGHYIHGKSVHGHADTDMRTMNYNFKKEQEDMCGRRGLEGDSDDQLFEVLLSRAFRTHYDKIVTPIKGEGGLQARNGDAGGASEAGLKAHQDMTYFLTTFIEHGLKDLDYCVGKKTVMERLIGIEFYDALDKSVFYKTSRYSFGDVLFYGCEWSLFQLDLLLFGVIGVVSNSYPLAAVLTLLVSWVVIILRDWFSRRNIARKTLVDERFLL